MGTPGGHVVGPLNQGTVDCVACVRDKSRVLIRLDSAVVVSKQCCEFVKRARGLENKTIAKLSAELAMKDKMTEAIVKAAVATAEKSMEATAHQQFREGMQYAQQFMAPIEDVRMGLEAVCTYYDCPLTLRVILKSPYPPLIYTTYIVQL